MMNTVTSKLDGLTLRSADIRGVLVPLRFALGTSASIVRSVPLVLLDIHTEEGVVGRTYLFCYTAAGAKAVRALLSEAVDSLRGTTVTPISFFTALSRRYTLLGVTGPVRMALSAIDVALWDALAVARGLPLATVLGASPRPVNAYDSRGLGLMSPERLGDEVAALLTTGLKALKVRLGHPTLADDIAALKAVRSVTPEDVSVMVDYNQALNVADAIIRGRALEDEGALWLEEPIRHDDYRGNARIANVLTIPLQLGENFNGPSALLDAMAVQASDYVMPDVSRIGGVTGWMQAAAMASAAGIAMSSHLLPEISVHLLAATPTAHWLEYVDWADAFLEQPLAVNDGTVTVPDRPGLGISWDEAKLKRLETI